MIIAFELGRYETGTKCRYQCQKPKAITQHETLNQMPEAVKLITAPLGDS